MTIGELPDIPFEDIKEGPVTKFYANDTQSAIVIEQNGQKVELTMPGIKRLPELAKRWIRYDFQGNKIKL